MSTNNKNKKQKLKIHGRPKWKYTIKDKKTKCEYLLGK